MAVKIVAPEYVLKSDDFRKNDPSVPSMELAMVLFNTTKGWDVEVRWKV